MNPLISDRFVDFLVSDVLELESVFAFPSFTSTGFDAVSPWFQACRRVARDVLFPSYQAIDASPPRFESGQVFLHPQMKASYQTVVELGVIEAIRQLPLSVSTLANAYLMAGNLSVFGLAGLTAGARHLLETFGSDEVKQMFLDNMSSGRWSGTMALSEPHAGSSLSDITTRARPTESGRFLLSGSKIFISGGDHDATDNIVHLVLARIEGAPSGSKGISLFAVPKRRSHAGALVPNDVHVTGVIHKIGWRGLPSVALSFGDAQDCHAWLVGAPHRGLAGMFQMMNEARIMVGVQAAATASVAFHESLAYARTRHQGRPLGEHNPQAPQVPLTRHPDVRRMLLRQKAIAEGSLALVALTARYADVAAHVPDEGAREHAQRILDILTPIAKSFPAERGFESNALAVQVHGGYGYSSEYLPEAWLRDQKLNSIHEGTTGIQALDLLGRKLMAGQGAGLMSLLEVMESDVAQSTLEVRGLRVAMGLLGEVTATLGMRGASGDLAGMLGHATDFLDAMSTVVLGWVWVTIENATRGATDSFAVGLRAAASYWLVTEVPQAKARLELCAGGESSFLDLEPHCFDGS